MISAYTDTLHIRYDFAFVCDTTLILLLQYVSKGQTRCTMGSYNSAICLGSLIRWLPIYKLISTTWIWFDVSLPISQLEITIAWSQLAFLVPQNGLQIDEGE